MRVASCLHGDEEQDKTSDREEGTKEVDLLDDLSQRLAMSTSLRGWPVEDKDANPGHGIPAHADPDGHAPRVVCAEELRVHEVRAEGDDGERDDGKVETSLLDWDKLRHTSQSSQLTDGSATTSQAHSHDTGCKRICCCEHDAADDEKDTAKECLISASEQILNVTAEWRNSREGETICHRKP